MMVFFWIMEYVHPVFLQLYIDIDNKSNLI